MKTKITIELPESIAKMLREDSAANQTTKTAWICRALTIARKCRRGNVTINGRAVVLL